MRPPAFHDLVEVLERAIAEYPQRNLFGTKIDGRWRWVSYKEFGRRVEICRGGLASLGVSRGDTVAIISINRVEWALTAYAVYGLGARLCPMHPRHHRENWEYIINDSGARVLLTSTYPIYEAVRDWAGKSASRLGKLEHVLCMDLPPEDEASFAALEVRGAAQPASSVEIDPGQICNFIYTSGSTAHPKAVLLSHANIVSNLNGISAIFPIDSSDVAVSFLPWAHSFGQTCELHGMLSRGAALAITESPETLAGDLIEIRPTVLYSTPRVFQRVYEALHQKLGASGIKKLLFTSAMANARLRARLAAKGRRWRWIDSIHRGFDGLIFSKIRQRFGGRLRFAVTGGELLSEVGDFFDQIGILVCESYGLTETCGMVATNQPAARKLGSVGRPIEGVDVTIDRGDGRAESDGGEIIVHGPNIMQGYHKLPEETRAVMTAEGSFRTGDLGYLDPDGFLYVTGRTERGWHRWRSGSSAPRPASGPERFAPPDPTALRLPKHRATDRHR